MSWSNTSHPLLLENGHFQRIDTRYLYMLWNYEAVMLWRVMFWILKIIFIVECWRFFYRLNLTKLKNESSLVQGGRKESWVGPNSINQSEPVSSQWPVPSSRYTNHSRDSRVSNEGSRRFHSHKKAYTRAFSWLKATTSLLVRREGQR